MHPVLECELSDGVTDAGYDGGGVCRGSAVRTASSGRLAPVAQGAYQNYIDPELNDWQQAYYGDNLSRLMSVKGKYDPDDSSASPSRSLRVEPLRRPRS